MSRADKFSDHMECVDYNSITRIMQLIKYKSLQNEHSPHVSLESINKLKNSADHELQSIASEIRHNQKMYFISCWYISKKPNESELMWRSYGGDHRSRGFLLKISLEDFLQHTQTMEPSIPQIKRIIYGRVKYFDYNVDGNIQKTKYASFRKHVCFEGESEFRLVFKSESAIHDPIYLLPSKYMFQCFSVSAHPDYSNDDYQRIRQKFLERHAVSIELSELDAWYSLKKKLSC